MFACVCVWVGGGGDRERERGGGGMYSHIQNNVNVHFVKQNPVILLLLVARLEKS